MLILINFASIGNVINLTYIKKFSFFIEKNNINIQKIDELYLKTFKKIIINF